MARIVGGPFGLISGKLGNRVYYIRNGKQMSRAVWKMTKPPTEGQLANLQKMKVAFALAKVLGPFVDVGFRAEAEARNIQPRNAAVGCIRTLALKGGYPDIEIDYPNLLLSRGNLPGLTEPVILVTGASGLPCDPQPGNGQGGSGLALLFSWMVEAMDRDWSRCSDQVMLMAYCADIEPADARACFTLSGARRSAGQDLLVLPDAFIGRAAEVYISVLSDDRKSVSCSQYLGRVDIE